MIVKPLSVEEQSAQGWTNVAIITYADFAAQTTANTALTRDILNPVVAGSTIGPMAWELITPFENTADAAFNTTTISIGDNSGVGTHIAATEANLNGTEVLHARGSSVVAYASAANKLAVTANSMGGKSLSQLNKGELHIFFTLGVPARLTPLG